MRRTRPCAIDTPTTVARQFSLPASLAREVWSKENVISTGYGSRGQPASRTTAVAPRCSRTLPRVSDAHAAPGSTVETVAEDARQGAYVDELAGPCAEDTAVEQHG